MSGGLIKGRQLLLGFITNANPDLGATLMLIPII